MNSFIEMLKNCEGQDVAEFRAAPMPGKVPICTTRRIDIERAKSFALDAVKGKGKSFCGDSLAYPDNLEIGYKRLAEGEGFDVIGDGAPLLASFSMGIGGALYLTATYTRELALLEDIPQQIANVGVFHALIAHLCGFETGSIVLLFSRFKRQSTRAYYRAAQPLLPPSISFPLEYYDTGSQLVESMKPEEIAITDYYQNLTSRGKK